MRANARIRKIEEELQNQLGIPVAQRIVVYFPSDTAEERAAKLEECLEKLRQVYGEAGSQQAINIVHVVYDA